MAKSRFDIAFSGDALEMPDTGRIAIWCPQVGQDLSIFARERVDIITSFYPADAHFRDLGYETTRDPKGRYALSLICIPRAKDAARNLVAEASAVTDGPVVVDGLKTDGIETIYKDCARLGDVSEAISKAHGKIFWFTELSGLEAWRKQAQDTIPGFVTAPGVFSADGIDPGSAELLKALPQKLGAHVVDLGAGWGYLARTVLERETVKTLDLVEADHSALECARENIADPRAQFHWADARDWHPDGAVDTVITNPPFHTGRDADPEIGKAFLRAGARMLKPNGHMWIVANRHLPYEPLLKELFHSVADVAGDNRYKVLHVEKPIRRKF